MSTAELQLDLIKSISSIQDVTQLEKIKQFLIIKNGEIDNHFLSEDSLLGVNETVEKYKKEQSSFKEEDVYVFTPEQRIRIEKALKQVENGECISDEDAQKEIEKWFEEQE